MTVNGTFHFGIGDKRENLVDADATIETQSHRRRRVEIERKRTACRNDKPRHDRRAERHKLGKTLSVQSLDRQCEERFAAAGDPHRPPGVKFGDPAIDADLFFRAEQSGNHTITD